MRFWATLFLLTSTLCAYGISMRRLKDTLAMPLTTLDAQIDGWTHTATQDLPPGVLQQLRPSSYLSRTYAKDGHELGLFIAYYAQQRAGESMHSPKNCLPGSGWEIWKSDSARVLVNDQSITINKYSIQNSGHRMVAFYWYQSKKRIIASEYLAKVVLITDTLRDGHTAGSIVRIIVPDSDSATESGLSFAAAVIPKIQRCIGR